MTESKSRSEFIERACIFASDDTPHPASQRTSHVELLFEPPASKILHSFGIEVSLCGSRFSRLITTVLSLPMAA
jgi:hypothetical protein